MHLLLLLNGSFFFLNMLRWFYITYKTIKTIPILVVTWTVVGTFMDEHNFVPVVTVLFLSLPQDPLSHRIIEKRRRDRMNNCLADLSRLIPTYYLKKGRGRIEKTEIIEMAIKYMKHLQAHACNQIGEHWITLSQGRFALYFIAMLSSTSLLCLNKESAGLHHWRAGGLGSLKEEEKSAYYWHDLMS